MNHDEVAAVLRQDGERQRSLENGDGPWTIVNDNWRTPDGNGGRFVAFSDPAVRAEAMKTATWNITRGQGVPGFSQGNRGDGEWSTWYERNTSGPEFEALLILQEFGGVVPSPYLLSQEFVLLMHLWQDPATGNYFEISDDGEKLPGVEFEGNIIRVRTPLLRRYQAARQLDLLLYVDSVQYVDTAESESAFDSLREDDHLVRSDAVAFLGIGRSTGRGQLLSRLILKRLLPAPPQEESGIWPWEPLDDHFPEFIISEDANGREVRHTCDPERLANYFGKNPDAPHYLTPVFFRPEVLKRYYDDPFNYSVVDGRLSRAYLWGVQIDNGMTDAVMVFLGDLGRDLPASHRDHWRSYNIPPIRAMSESTFRRSFLAQFRGFSESRARVQERIPGAPASLARHVGLGYLPAAGWNRGPDPRSCACAAERFGYRVRGAAP